MNISVLVFFLHNVFATLFLGSKFVVRKDGAQKNFGIALLLNAVAFAIWSMAIISQATNIETYVSLGVVFFVVSLLYFLRAGTENITKNNRQIITVLGVLVGIIFLYVRAFVYPSAPGFSAEGFFFFNPHPVMQMFYIFALMLAVIPAVNVVSGKFNNTFHVSLLRYGFIAEVAGAIVLITSSINNPDTTPLFITGWIMGLAFLLMWTNLALGKKAWV